MVGRHRTVSRVVGILEHVVRSERGASLQELVEESRSPRSSIYDFVRGLVDEGYLVEVPEGGRYVLGLGAHALLASRSTSVVELVEPVMRELARGTGETVTLAVPVGSELSYVHTVPSRHPIAYSPVLRTRRSLWPSSSGKIFLAYDAPGVDVTEAPGHTDVPGEVVEVEIALTTRRGYATNIGESVTDVAAVAVGVVVAGNVVAALSVAGPRARIEEHLERAAGSANLLLADHGLGIPR
ncbi:IclR family transcriptional regulator [Nocardiopsis sp. NPDC055879]